VAFGSAHGVEQEVLPVPEFFMLLLQRLHVVVEIGFELELKEPSGHREQLFEPL